MIGHDNEIGVGRDAALSKIDTGARGMYGPEFEAISEKARAGENRATGWNAVGSCLGSRRPPGDDMSHLISCTMLLFLDLDDR